MTSEIEIEKKKIGRKRPTYIIAEIGINHNGNEDIAYELINAAVEAQVDAVKFQKRDLASIYTNDVLNFPEKYEQTFQYMIPLLKKVELEEECYIRLKHYCDEKGITFISTPFDIKSADFLNSIDIPAFKIASADLTNDILLDHVSDFGKPIIVSTGMSTWDEIELADNLLRRKNANYSFLHCRSVYPVWPREVNLGMIDKLRKYNVPVGYSGHEIGITVALVAASMGAEIIEKHITLDRKQDGPDHKSSLEPYELKRLVRDIRVADQALGKNKRFMLRGEVLNRELFAKCLTAVVDIAKGTIVKEEMIIVKGPAKGLEPYRKNELVGKKINRDIKTGDYFVEEDLDIATKENFSESFKSDWGLIARFTDYKEMLSYRPKVIEFHLAENDFNIPFYPDQNIDCKLIVHCPEYLGENLMDLCCADEAIREESVALVLKTIDLTKKINVFFKKKAKVIIHPGAMSLQTKLSSDLLESKLEKSINEIRENNNVNDVDLLLENLPPYPWYFGGQWKGNYFMDSQEIVDFCEKNQILICFDLSHSALYCNAKQKSLSDEIKNLLPYISHLHLADGYGLDGEGVQFGDGDIDLENVLPLFKNFRGTWVPEIWRGHLHNGKGFIYALNYLKNCEKYF